MRIEYEVTPNDWAAFGEYHARKSPQFQRATWTAALGGMFLLLAVALLMWVNDRSIAWSAFMFVIAVVWAVYWPRQVVANVRSYMANKDRPCLRGRHIMEIVPDGLRSKCDITDSTVAWIGIRDVIQTQQHFFVMLDDMQGHVISKAQVTSGELGPFMLEVDRLRGKSSTSNTE